MRRKSISILLSVTTVMVGLIAGYQTTLAHRSHHDQDQEETVPRMHSTVPFRPVTLNELERFHGHIGPYVTLGARMGEHAITHYKLPRYFGIAVEVECPAQPPQSCLIDGLMVTTGATYGKKNIHHTQSHKIRVIIRNEDTGAAVAYTLKSTTQKILQQWIEDDVPISERGKRCFAMQAEELFDIQLTSKVLPVQK